MEERTLELNVISAQNLKKVKKFGEQCCYAVAYIRSREKKSSRVDKDGGLNPTWNAKLMLNCDEKLLQRGGKCITVEIYSHGTFRNTLVGSSRISLFEIGKQVAAAAPPKLLSFDVLRPSGTVRGVLNVSVKAVQGKRPSTLQKTHTRKAPFLAPVPMGYPHAYPPKSSNLQVETPYPPPKSSITDSKTDSEFVIAYPASGYPAFYPPQQYGQQYDKSQYYGSQNIVGPERSYYSATQAPRPHEDDQEVLPYDDDQEIYYSKSSRRPCCSYGKNRRNSGSSGMGIGLAGRGYLVGDMTGDLV